MLPTGLTIDARLPGDVRAESARALRSRLGLAAHASAGVLAKNSLAAGLQGTEKERSVSCGVNYAQRCTVRATAPTSMVRECARDEGFNL